MSEWRPVRRWESYYAVSDQGEVMTIRTRVGTRAGRILKHTVGWGGYPTVNLCRRGNRISAFVHRLVCEAFHGPAPEGHEVNHRDGVRTNPVASNLEWVTRSENMQHLHNELGYSIPDSTWQHRERRPNGQWTPR